MGNSSVPPGYKEGQKGDFPIWDRIDKDGSYSDHREYSEVGDKIQVKGSFFPLAAFFALIFLIILYFFFRPVQKTQNTLNFSASPSSIPTVNSSASPIPNSTASTTHVSFDGTPRSRSSLSPFTSRQNHRKSFSRYSEETFQSLFEENENKDDTNDSLQFLKLESKYYTLREVPEYKNDNTKMLDSHNF